MWNEVAYHFAIAFASGTWAFLFCRVLTSPGMIFEQWPELVSVMLYGECPPIESPRWQVGIEKVAYDCPVCQSFWWALLCTGFEYPAFLWATGPAMLVAYILDRIKDLLTTR